MSQLAQITVMQQRLEDIQLSLGRLETHLNRQLGTGTAWDFQVFSQWNEDGILQWILAQTPLENRRFVEFGVGDYRESNTRFLLRKDYWEGLVIDADAEALNRLRQDDLVWRHGLHTTEAFITRENINSLIASVGFAGDLALLSIDLDGNDYWIWQAIEVVRPRIVVVEYNGLFPPGVKVSIPYKEDFRRADAHPGLGYWGASLGAFEYLAARKGYRLVSVNSAGSNAFFIRQDVLRLQVGSADTLHRYPCFREARDANGRLLDLNSKQWLELMADLSVVDVTTGNMILIREILKHYPNG